ncbi:cupredoxin domain-containing protein [Cohnella mopanensis]|uniref:cupredoxin domain-containing protein n=1 Tax=Cohnella mopanensis TaxID=2911966 RepID=UPI001EF95E53|nr:cupredoxin domain-containing protein [Cohnella mopanensis]
MKKQSNKLSLFFALVALAAVLALSACGNNNDSASSPSASAEAPASASASAPAAGGETKEITITATNFKFSEEVINAKVGDTLILNYKNENGNHGLGINDLNVKLKNGESATIVLDKAGTYEFNCSIMCGTGHDNMVGKLVVE